MSSAPHVSLWLIPAEPERTALQLLIDGLAARFGGAPFPAHVTLCSDPEPDDEATLAARAETFSPTLRSISMRTAGLGAGTSFSTFFHVRLASPEPPDLLARGARHFAAARTPSIGPHLSLLYAEPDATIDRAALARELAPALPELLRVDALASAHAESGDRKDVASWRHRVLARVHAAGGDR